MKIQLTAEQVQDGVRRLAAELHDYYHDRPVTIVAVLTGSIVFAADLIRRLRMPLRLGVVQARSYRGADTRPGELVIDDQFLPDLRDRDVLIVDDIFDTGRTLAGLMEQLERHEPATLRSVVLLEKEGRREVDLTPDHVGFQIPDAFVVGYGLDHDDLFRNLPYLALLEATDLESREPGP